LPEVERTSKWTGNLETETRLKPTERKRIQTQSGKAEKVRAKASVEGWGKGIPSSMGEGKVGGKKYSGGVISKNRTEERGCR